MFCLMRLSFGGFPKRGALHAEKINNLQDFLCNDNRRNKAHYHPSSRDNIHHQRREYEYCTIIDEYNNNKKNINIAPNEPGEPADSISSRMKRRIREPLRLDATRRDIGGERSNHSLNRTAAVFSGTILHVGKANN